MSRTRRRQQTNKQSKAQRLEREWERKVTHQEISMPAVHIKQSYEPVLLPPGVETIRQEAETIVNRRLGTTLPQINKARSPAPYSVQSPPANIPSEVGGGLIWWTGGHLSQYIPLGQYGDPQRAKDIRAFALVSPFILNAEAALTKKVQALQWTIEGGRNLAQKWQRRLNNFENGDGWDFFIARWIRAYCESDKLACTELIRQAPGWAIDMFTGVAQLTPRGEKAIENGRDKTWEIVDSRVMDPVSCFPTNSKEFPLIYQNPFDGSRHRMRPYQFMSLIDLPAVDDRFPGHGVCAVSRAVWAAQEDRMIIRYAMEKMSENPGSGIGIINASVNTLETALNSAESEREARGAVYYKGVIFIPVLDPTGSTKMEFLSFANLPDGFDRTSVYNMIKEIVAAAFGLDILELGAISGRLGTATQAKVAAQKGRTKTIGAIMQGVERAFRYKLLPESLTFSIKKHDQAEEMQRAEIDQIYFENAIRMAQFADPLLATQYLADKGAIPNEPPYVMIDLTQREEIGDVQAPGQTTTEGDTQAPVGSAEAIETGPEGAAEAEIVRRLQRDGPRVQIDRNGKIKYLEMTYQLKQRRRLPAFTPARINQALARFDKTHPEHAGRLG